MARNSTWILLSVGLLTAVGPALGSPSWVLLEVGMSGESSKHNSIGDTWTVSTTVDAQVSLNSLDYYHVRIFNYGNQSDVRDYYWRATEDAVYQYNPAGADFLIFQEAPVGTLWSYPEQIGGYNYKVLQVVAIEGVTVPYGTFPQAYEIRNYACYDPSNLALGKSPDWYDWVVPGLTNVKEVDYWDAHPPTISELVSLTLPGPIPVPPAAIPAPSALLLAGLGASLLGWRRRRGLLRE